MSLDIEGSIETVKEDIGLSSADKVKRWVKEIDLFEKNSNVREWKKLSKDIIRKLRCEVAGDSSYHKQGFNLLWANVETERAALFAKRPNPIVSRRQKDSNPITRLATELLEKNVECQIDSDDNYFDSELQDAITDWQATGWGWLWVSYKPQMKEREVSILYDRENDIFKDVTGTKVEKSSIIRGDNGTFFLKEEVLDYDEVKLEYVPWDEVGLTLTKRWKDVRAVWRKHKLTKEQCIEKFGEEIGGEIPLNLSEITSEIDEVSLGGVADLFKRVEVYEIYDKLERKIVWVCKDYYHSLLLEEEDKLKLKNFFPCPKPLTLEATTSSLIPVPQAMHYWGLLKELDKVNARITNLIPTIKVGGVTSKRFAEELNKMFSLPDGQYLPLNNFSEFMSNHRGLQGVLAEIPIDKTIQAVSTLIDYRARLLSQIYEVRGISDLMRGYSNPQETATAQRLKTQYGQLRINPRQREVQRFCRDAISLVAETVCNTFSKETLLEVAGEELLKPFISQADGLPSFKIVDKAIELLQNDDIRNFRIEIEIDSTLVANEIEEKKEMVEAFQTINEGVQAALPAMQTAPELAKLESELLKMVVRTFRGSRQVEGIAEKAFEDLKERVKTSVSSGRIKEEGQQKLVENMQKMQAESTKERQRMELELAKLRQEAEIARADFALKQQELSERHEREIAKLRTNIMMKREERISKEQIERERLIQKEKEAKNVQELDLTSI